MVPTDFVLPLKGRKIVYWGDYTISEMLAVATVVITVMGNTPPLWFVGLLAGWHLVSGQASALANGNTPKADTVSFSASTCPSWHLTSSTRSG